jgi:hypothetical protein
MFSPRAAEGCKKYGRRGIEFRANKLEVNQKVWGELGGIAEYSIAKKTWNTYGTAERMLAKFHKEKAGLWTRIRWIRIRIRLLFFFVFLFFSSFFFLPRNPDPGPGQTRFRTRNRL